MSSKIYTLPLLLVLFAASGCPGDDAPRGPYSSGDPDVADDGNGETTAKPEPDPVKPEGDGDPSTAPVCEAELAALTECLATAK